MALSLVMRSTLKASLIGIGSAFALAAACGGGGGGSGLHAEVMPFGGLMFDTGSVPASSPVTFDFKASASGTVDLDASKSSPSKGTISMAAKIVLAGTAKSTLTGATYDGPIKGAPVLSIAFTGKSALDLTMVGTPSTVSATVPASDLATIPLATALGIPAVTGNLDLKVVGGTITSVYNPTCAMTGSYAGTVTTSGSLMIGGDVVVAVPLVGSQTIAIPTFTVPVPQTVDAVTLGASGCGTASTDGGTIVNPTGDGGTMTGSDGGSGGFGTLTPIPDAGAPDGSVIDYDTAADGGAVAVGIAPSDNSLSIDDVAVPIAAVEAAAFQSAWVMSFGATTAAPNGGYVVVGASTTGASCSASQNVVFGAYTTTDPNDNSATVFTSATSGTCGLFVEAVSTAANGGIHASFSGAVTSSDGTTQHNVTAEFDILN